jgi:hypothetical protein
MKVVGREVRLGETTLFSLSWLSHLAESTDTGSPDWLSCLAELSEADPDNITSLLGCPIWLSRLMLATEVGCNILVLPLADKRITN